ncbi:MAG: hypothetical protein ACXWKH_10935 [Limisphaerales bacterium]
MWPADDVNGLVDPGLRMVIVEAVDIIEVDWNVGIGQMRAGYPTSFLISPSSSAPHPVRLWGRYFIAPVLL